MSKVVLVCVKSQDPALLARTHSQLARFLDALRPDNLPEAPAQIITDGHGLFIGTFNPVEGSIRDYATYAGWLRHGAIDWWEPGTPAPDGAFALVRADRNVAEAVADFAATRTLWIGHSPDIFVASTSQRAIPWFLGHFTPDYEAVAWMLSSGSLGPGHAWDQRARPLAPAARARLDRDTWNLRISEPSIEFRPAPLPREQQRAELSEALREACSDLNVDWSQWVLPLSGGNDCRAILLRIADRKLVRTVTWGLREALDTPGTDAYVARELAACLGLKHEYMPTDLSHEQPERVLQRFLLAGDARVDHIAGYMDGFELWRRLNRNGVAGIVRGDHAFGRKGIGSPREAPLIAGLVTWADYPDLPSLASLGLEYLGRQEMPLALARRNGESPPDWRDRLVHAFNIPAVLAALTDLKSAYVEVANPLLIQPLVALARSQPAPLRMDKRLFREVAAETSVPVAYASSRAVAETTQALSHSRMVECLRDHARSRTPRELLSPALMDLIDRRLVATGSTKPHLRRESAVRKLAKRVLPKGLRTALAPRPYARRISGETLALRSYLICEMHSRLRLDGQSAD
jgi:hypothetical protein